MEHTEKKPVNDIFLFFLLLILSILGVVAFAMRGLTEEAGYPFAFPILVLAAIHPILCLADRFWPLKHGIGVSSKNASILLNVAMGTVLIFSILSILSETGTLGDALRSYGPGLAYFAAIPSTFLHGYFLVEGITKTPDCSQKKKASVWAIYLLFFVFSLAGLVMTFLNELPFALFLLPSVFFSITFPVRAFE